MNLEKGGDENLFLLGKGQLDAFEGFCNGIGPCFAFPQAPIDGELRAWGCIGHLCTWGGFATAVCKRFYSSFLQVKYKTE